MKNYKKALLSLAFAPLMLGAIAGCSSNTEAGPYTDVNKLLGKNYSSFVMTVTTLSGGHTLESTYSFTRTASGYSVEYSIEKFASVDLTQGAPASQTYLETGTKTGKGSLNFNKFKVSDKVYAGIEISDDHFHGEAKNAKSLLGVSYAVSGCEVDISFSDQIDSIVCAYSTDNAVNTITYSGIVM